MSMSGGTTASTCLPEGWSAETPRGSAASEPGRTDSGSPATAFGIRDMVAPGLSPPENGEEQRADSTQIARCDVQRGEFSQRR